MAFTFFGVATTPADNSGSSTGPTVTITPPGSMADGDLVYVSVRYRASTATLTVSNTGGQSWSQVGAQYNTTNIRAAIFWCRFNGTWSANPSFTVTTGTNNIDAQMLVFRPSGTSYTLSIESGENGATYSAPSTPFTVTITGRTTTAASTVTIAAWHSVDDNSWGSLAGTGWSKTSLAAQYRNNDTADNSSTFAYYIATSAATAIPNVSQNQSALGGDAGSTSLVTFAETQISRTLTGVASSSAAGSLGRSVSESGLQGLSATASVGTITIPEASGSNATASPTGVSSACAIGTLALLLSQVMTPTGVGVGAAAAALSVSTASVPVGVSAAAAAGAASAIGASAGIVPVGGVVSTAAPGSLGSSIATTGIEGVSSSAAAGDISSAGTGIILGAGSPSSVIATAQLGAIAIAVSLPVSGVVSTITAESMLSSSILEEIDGNQGSSAANSVTPLIAAPITGVNASGAAGSTAIISASVIQPAGVGAIATVGNLAGLTAGNSAGAPGGVSASALVGTLEPSWTVIVELVGVESTAGIGDAEVEGGDSVGVETFPAGVEATVQLGALSTGEARAALSGIQIQALAGFVIPLAAIPEPLDRADAIRVMPELDGIISVAPELTADRVIARPLT